MYTLAKYRRQVPARSLSEALDSAVEITVTEDTKLPQSIYGIYELDGVQYGMSLEESDFPKIYILRQYRIVNQKVRLWSYIKASHFRPSLATLLKFCELSIPFLQAKMDGIIVQIPGKMQPEVLNGLLEKMVKKTYIKTFRSVKVMSNDKQQAYNYAFIIRKTKSPQALFSSKFFSKYSFDNIGSDQMPADAAADIKPKKKVEKVMVSVTPSKKVQFKGFEIANTGNAEGEVEKVINKDSAKIKTLKGNEIFLQHEHPFEKPPEEKPAGKPVAPPPKPTLPKPPEKPFHLDNAQLAMALMMGMPSMASKIKQYGFDESKFDKGLFGKVLNKLEQSNFHHLPQVFKANGWMSELGDLTPTGVLKAKWLLKIASDITKDPKAYPNGPTGLVSDQHTKDIVKVNNMLTAWNNYYSELKKMKMKHDAEVANWEYEYGGKKKTNQANMVTKNGKEYKPPTHWHPDSVSYVDEDIDFSQLKSDLPGSGEYTFTDYHTWGVEIDEQISQKINHIQAAGFGTHGYLTKKGVTAASRNAVLNYTGSSYSDYNGTLRGAFNEILSGDKDPDKHKPDNLYNWSSYGAGITKLNKAFEDIEPFPFNMWVYRGTHLKTEISETNLYPGKYFVDPGFMSCAIHSTNTFGLSNLKLRIFIPKGSRIIPCLDESNHPNEKEIILPAASVLKIIRYDKKTSTYDTEHHVTCVYTGSVYKDVMAKYKGALKLSEAKKPTPPKKDPKYDVNKKFAGNGFDPKLARAISKMIKDGKATPKK